MTDKSKEEKERDEVLKKLLETPPKPKKTEKKEGGQDTCPGHPNQSNGRKS